MIIAIVPFNIRVFEIPIPIIRGVKSSPHTCPVVGITCEYMWGQVFLMSLDLAYFHRFVEFNGWHIDEIFFLIIIYKNK